MFLTFLSLLFLNNESTLHSVISFAMQAQIREAIGETGFQICIQNITVAVVNSHGIQFDPR